MKLQATRILPILSVAFAALTLGPAPALGPSLVFADSPVAYEIDPAHSEIGFKVRHFVSKVPGRFNQFQGTILYDAENPAGSSTQITIDAPSINTNNERRDTHLKSPDFFDVAKFPTLTFVSKSIAFDGNAFTMIGDLTMHGVTKPVTLTGEMTGLFTVSAQENRIGFSASTKVNRKDYGIVWNKTLDQGATVLGDEVEVAIEIEANHKVPKPEESAADKAGK